MTNTLTHVPGPWIRRVLAGVASVVPRAIADRLGIGVVNVNANCSIESAALGGMFLHQDWGPTPTSGSGVRLMWIPSKTSFRAGVVTGTAWDDANIGSSSVAFGYDCQASGQYSTAAGHNSVASGQSSIALGDGPDATNSHTIALGRNAQATQWASVAIGESADASGTQGYALGKSCTASGGQSLAMGNTSTASATASMVLGEQSQANATHAIAIGYQCTASGDYSLAMCDTATASGNNSVAIGDTAIASAQNAVAIGTNVTASGGGSFAANQQNQATASWSHALGYGGTSSGNAAMTSGAYCQATANYSQAFGIYGKTDRAGETAWACGRIAATGDSKPARWDGRRQHAAASTGAEMTGDGAAPTGTAIGSSNRFVLRTNTTIHIDGEVTARDLTTGDSKAWHIDALLEMTAAGSGRIVGGAPTIAVHFGDAATAAWTCTLAIDGTGNIAIFSVNDPGGFANVTDSMVQLRYSELS